MLIHCCDDCETIIPSLFKNHKPSSYLCWLVCFLYVDAHTNNNIFAHTNNENVVENLKGFNEFLENCFRQTLFMFVLYL